MKYWWNKVNSSNLLIFDNESQSIQIFNLIKSIEFIHLFELVDLHILSCDWFDNWYLKLYKVYALWTCIHKTEQSRRAVSEVAQRFLQLLISGSLRSFLSRKGGRVTGFEQSGSNCIILEVKSL